MKPYIIWAETRTASAALSAALRAVSSYPSLEDEPFLYNTPREHAEVYRHWCKTGEPGPLYRVLEPKPGIKHIAEPFHDGFNAHLAQAANHFGYRHIRLERRNVFAQLASRGIAEQLDAWDVDTARRKFGKLPPLKPFDVADLLRKRAHAQSRWEAARRHIPVCLDLRTEDLISPVTRLRRAVLKALLHYLEIPLGERVQVMDDILSRSGQNTEAVLARVPNIGELLRATA
jgi:hypothetical protein